MRALAFHSLLWWNIIMLPQLSLPQLYIHLEKVGRMYFLSLGVKVLMMRWRCALEASLLKRTKCTHAAPSTPMVSQEGAYQKFALQSVFLSLYCANKRGAISISRSLTCRRSYSTGHCVAVLRTKTQWPPQRWTLPMKDHETNHNIQSTRWWSNKPSRS